MATAPPLRVAREVVAVLVTLEPRIGVVTCEIREETLGVDT